MNAYRVYIKNPDGTQHYLGFSIFADRMEQDGDQHCFYDKENLIVIINTELVSLIRYKDQMVYSA